MDQSVSYASTREEVWRHYWLMWRRHLWKAHLAIFVMVAAAAYVMVPTNESLGLVTVAKIVMTGIAPLLFLIMYPMLRFKPQVRQLTMNSEGLATSIGRQSGMIPWSDIAWVENDGSALVIQGRNLNAFIVPARAFDAPGAMEKFAAAVHNRIKAHDD